MPFPGDLERYPYRDEVIAYLKGYAEHFTLPVVTNARVQQVIQQDGLYTVTTVDNKQYEARTIIAATGSFNNPHLPLFSGQATFTGELLHSFQYHNPLPYHGKRVVVVGAGNSAVQIAIELARVAHVTLTSRTPIKFQRQRILGRDIHFWLKITGLDTLPSKYFQRVSGSVAVLDTGIYRAAIETGKPDHRPMFHRFTPNGVIWSDGCEDRIDSVIFATGYKPNLDFLNGLDSISSDGKPQQRDGIGKLPGLYFVGLSWQRSHASATLRGVGADAEYVTSHLVHYLQTTTK